jgi:hypothetical protein
VSEEGWISNYDYNHAVRKIAQLKAELITSAEGDEADRWILENSWLFRDHEESD